MRAVLATAAAATVFVLGACGGEDGMAADDYRTQLDAACERLTEELAGLPQVVAEENLDIDEAAELADAAGVEFAEEVESLEPPEELSTAHEELVSATEETPLGAADPAEVRELALEFAGIYEDLGAEGCAEGQRRAAEQLDELPSGE